VNFFGVKNGKLYTSEEGILYGCTRKFILELAKVQLLLCN
jgi:branched-subunit amino acid aminotransferase/4-amino-4-deoxychorismate lyase